MKPEDCVQFFERRPTADEMEQMLTMFRELYKKGLEICADHDHAYDAMGTYMVDMVEHIDPLSALLGPTHEKTYLDIGIAIGYAVGKAQATGLAILNSEPPKEGGDE